VTELSELRDYVMEHRWDPAGVHCPVCDQLAKVYYRHIAAGQARNLIALYRQRVMQPDDGWMNVNNLPSTGREEGKMICWGLVEQDERGWWRITDKGAMFVLRIITVERTAHLYDGACLGHSEGEPWSIRDALGKRFDYDELMRNE